MPEAFSFLFTKLTSTDDLYTIYHIKPYINQEETRTESLSLCMYSSTRRAYRLLRSATTRKPKKPKQMQHMQRSQRN